MIAGTFAGCIGVYAVVQWPYDKRNISLRFYYSVHYGLYVHSPDKTLLTLAALYSVDKNSVINITCHKFSLK